MQALFNAIEQQNEQEIEQILSQDKGSYYLNERSSGHNNRTPLMVAVYANHERIVRLLVSKKPNLNLFDNSGKTALHLAFETRNKSIIKFLVENGADVNIANHVPGYNCETAFLWAVTNNYEDIVKLMFEKCASINLESRGRNKETALLLAAQYKYESMAILLVNQGADVNAIGNYDQTPLLHAATNKLYALVQILLDKGANPNFIAKDVFCALQQSVNYCDDRMANMLIENGADLYIKFKTGGGNPFYIINACAENSSSYQFAAKLGIMSGQKIIQLRTEVKQLAKQNTELTQEINRLKTEAELLNQKLEESQQKVQLVESDLATSQADTNTLTEQLQQQRLRFESSEQQLLQKHADEIIQFERQLSEAQSTIEACKEQLDEKEQKVQSLSYQVNQIGQQYQEQISLNKEQATQLQLHSEQLEARKNQTNLKLLKHNSPYDEALEKGLSGAKKHEIQGISLLRYKEQLPESLISPLQDKGVIVDLHEFFQTIDDLAYAAKDISKNRNYSLGLFHPKNKDPVIRSYEKSASNNNEINATNHASDVTALKYQYWQLQYLLFDIHYLQQKPSMAAQSQLQEWALKILTNQLLDLQKPASQLEPALRKELRAIKLADIDAHAEGNCKDPELLRIINSALNNYLSGIIKDNINELKDYKITDYEEYWKAYEETDNQPDLLTYLELAYAQCKTKRELLSITPAQMEKALKVLIQQNNDNYLKQLQDIIHDRLAAYEQCLKERLKAIMQSYDPRLFKPEPIHKRSALDTEISLVKADEPQTEKTSAIQFS